MASFNYYKSKSLNKYSLGNELAKINSYHEKYSLSR